MADDHDLEQARAYATHLREMLTLARPHITGLGGPHAPECHCIRCEVDHALSVTSGIETWPVPPPFPETQGEPMSEPEETREEAVERAGKHPFTGATVEVEPDDTRETLMAKAEPGKPIGTGIDLFSRDPHEDLHDKLLLWFELWFSTRGYTGKNLPPPEALAQAAQELGKVFPPTKDIYDLATLRIDASSSAANMMKQIEEAVGASRAHMIPVPWVMDKKETGPASDPWGGRGAPPAPADPEDAEWAARMQQDTEVLIDLLNLVEEEIPETTRRSLILCVNAWSPAQRLEAARWAWATHLHASDNEDVVVPETPAFFR